MVEMTAGELRNRVTLQQQAKSPNGRGGQQYEWVDVAPLWASVLPHKQPYEQVQTRQVQSGATHTVKVRYRQGITASMRFLSDGRHLYILGPLLDPDGRRRWLEAHCEERRE